MASFSGSNDTWIMEVSELFLRAARTLSALDELHRQLMDLGYSRWEWSPH
jgi:hypothetical protein